MVVEIIGTELKSGSFTDPKTGKEVVYNNIFLYCSKDNTYESEGNFGCGLSCLSLKIKNTIENISSIFGFVLTKDDLESMIGNKYNLFYNDKQQIDSIIPFAPPTPPTKKEGK